MPWLRQERRGKRANSNPSEPTGILLPVIAMKHSVCTIFPNHPSWYKCPATIISLGYRHGQRAMINDISQNHADIFSYQAAGTGMVRAGLSVRVRQASHLITRARSLSGANAEGWRWSLEMGLRWQRPILKRNLEAQKEKLYMCTGSWTNSSEMDSEKRRVRENK